MQEKEKPKIRRGKWHITQIIKCGFKSALEEDMNTQYKNYHIFFLTATYILPTINVPGKTYKNEQYP